MERKDAKMMGLDKYTTGRPCANGHLAFRYTASGSCSQCVNGQPKSHDPKTFQERANLLRTTALTTYNEIIKTATENYETAMKQAAEYEEMAKQVDIKNAMDNLTKMNQIRLHEASQARKAALKRMVKVNVFIQPHDVVNAKAWLLEKAQSVCPELTMDDINYRNKVQGGVLYEIKCFPEHMSEVVAETNRVYNSDALPYTPATPQ